MELIFEYDPNKSASNEEKHGINFEAAQELWDGVIVEALLRAKPEPRLAVFGKMGGENWTAIITYRSERIRIISARRSTKKEVKFYEKNR